MASKSTSVSKPSQSWEESVTDTSFKNSQFARLSAAIRPDNHGRCKQRDFSHSFRVGAKGSGRMTKNISELTSNGGRKKHLIVLIVQAWKKNYDDFWNDTV